ncbi:MAG TPA: phosphonate ABC transporter substrate-binding protein [Nitratifractor sp.]|nr:phosphonate ABC transporter substrate-binding protein [Nitratifractor sp.]HHH20621.1 phosphonate ABC transporter substrate-binding protein [Nitratifractor sp.]
MRREFLKKSVLATMALTLGLSTLSAKEADWPKEITYGVIPVAGSEGLQNTFGKVTKYLEGKLGIKVKMVTPSDYAGVITAMQHKHVDLAYFGPKSYCEAAKRAGAEAVAVEVDAEGGIPGYYGYIITKKGSKLKSLEDIKGKTWAFTDPHSTSGTLVPTVMFAKKKIDPKKYFSKVIYSGSHEASILSVKNGKVDAASTNNLDYNRGLGKAWTKDDFNIIWKSDLIPGSPMAVRKDLPESLKKAIKDAFISYDDKENLKAMKILGYKAADDKMYDGVRELIELKKSLSKKQ